jgi:hypothetical protein
VDADSGIQRRVFLTDFNGPSTRFQVGADDNHFFDPVFDAVVGYWLPIFGEGAKIQVTMGIDEHESIIALETVTGSV